MSDMLSDLRIDEKISHIRDTLHKLGSTIGKDDDDYQSYLFKRVGSANSSVASESLDVFLDEKYAEDKRRIDMPLASKQSTVRESEMKLYLDDMQIHRQEFDNSPSFISPRFPTDVADTYVSEYVLYGNERDSYANQMKTPFTTVDSTLEPSYEGILIDPTSTSKNFLEARSARSHSHTQQSTWDLPLQYDVNKEKIEHLEDRIGKKDSLLNEMTALQNDLYKNLDENQQQIAQLKLAKNKQADEQSNLINQLQDRCKQLENERDQLMVNTEQIKRQQSMDARQMQDLENAEKGIRDEYEKIVDELRSRIINLENLLREQTEKTRKSDDRGNELELNAQTMEQEYKEHLNKLNNEITRLCKAKDITSRESAAAKELEQGEQQSRYQKIIISLEKSKQELEEKLREAEYETSRALTTQRQSLEQKMVNLEHENWNMSKQISDNPLKWKLKEAEDKITDLWKQVDTLRHHNRSRSRSRSRSANKRNRNRSTSKEPRRYIGDSKPRATSFWRDAIKHDKENYKHEQLMPSYKSLQKICRQVLNALNLTQVSDIHPEISKLLKIKKNFQSAKHFIERVTDAVKNFSPPGSFETAPSLKHVWKWIRRLISEYMTLQKANKNTVDNQYIVEQLLQSLNLVYPQDLPVLKDRINMFKDI